MSLSNIGDFSFMSMMERMSDECLAEYAVEETKELNVYTTNGKQDGSNWAYEIRAEHPLGEEDLLIHEDAGNVAFCCSECKELKEETLEHYAVMKALKWIEEMHPRKRAHVWANSEHLGLTSSESFDYGSDYFDCDGLRDLNNELCRLWHYLNVCVNPNCKEKIDN